MASSYNLPTIIKGDTFKDLQFTITVNAAPLDLTGYTIECKFRKSSKTGTIAKSIDTTSGITLTTPASGIFKIDAFTCDFTAGTYYYDIEFTSTTGVINTYVSGQMKIEQDVTY